MTLIAFFIGMLAATTPWPKAGCTISDTVVIAVGFCLLGMEIYFWIGR